MLVKSRRCPRTHRVRFFALTRKGWRLVSGHQFAGGRLTGTVSVGGSRRFVALRCLAPVLEGNEVEAEVEAEMMSKKLCECGKPRTWTGFCAECEIKILRRAMDRARPAAYRLGDYVPITCLECGTELGEAGPECLCSDCREELDERRELEASAEELWIETCFERRS